MKNVLICLVLVSIFCIAGCQNQNRFSIHGSEIVTYEGDWDVLSNCCHAAMSLLADDLKKEKGLDSYPPVTEVGTGWSQDGQTSASRMILSCIVDEMNYRIDVIRIGKKPARVTIDSPPEDSKLVNHLMKLFSNFDVKSVKSI